MPEALKTNGGELAGEAGASQFEALAGMSDKFDPDEARELAERDELESEPPKRAEHLAVASEHEKGEEISPEDAATEYLSLLDELSQDFTYPYYGEERKGRHHYAGGITAELGREYSDNPHYRWQGYAGTEAGETDGTMLRIASADKILEHEIGWRVEGEQVAEKMGRIDKDIADLDADYNRKGRLGKFLGKKKYERAKQELESTKRSAELQVSRHNANIANELAISYNEEGDYDGAIHRKPEENEAQNRRFFGLDNPERAKKVERAIALRQKYVAEWTKKK